MKEAFQILHNLGAGDFQHLNGSLESHLKNTQSILKSWNSPDLLQSAALFHAAYGTDGFTDNMVSLKQRSEIAKLIGKDEEALVYLYCACDRDFVFKQFEDADKIIFRDRFNNTEFELTPADTKLLCELTVANELELVFSSKAFKAKHGLALFKLFNNMNTFLSDSAINAYTAALSDLASSND